MQIVAINKITVNREGRQRRELTGLEDLADSIQRNVGAMPDTGGLIHPIVVTRDYELVAGERRFTACRDVLGYDKIAVNFADELSPTTLRGIELEENIKRVDISWQDRTRAIMEYHALRKADDPEWTHAATGRAIGLAQKNVSAHLIVAKEMSNPRVAEAPKFSTALGITERKRERADAAAIEDVKNVIADAVEKPLIVQGDFNEWARTYNGERFNFLHCDFPYGINAGDFNQGSADAHGGYEDSPEIYWQLLATLCDNLDKLAQPSAHILFWFSMHYYTETINILRTKTDFVVDPFPFIWHKSDGGILPDPQRGPRRKYETALFGRRGDRKITSATDNIYQAPLVRDRHMSEKPEPMLRHFFKMIVDEHTVMLDPTAGSGSSIRAARSLHAKSMLGLELNPEYVQLATLALKGLA